MEVASSTASLRRQLGRRDRRAAAVRTLLLAAGGAATAYTAYRLYRSHRQGTLAAWAASVSRLRAALAAYTDALGSGADTLALLAADLRAFLGSDSTDLPPSLRQLARLLQSPEVASTTSATVAALLRGVSGSTSVAANGSSGGGSNGSTHAEPQPAKPALDRVLEALLSDRGHSLVSVAVSLGARNLVTAWCDAQHRLTAADAAAAAAARAAAAAASGAPLPPVPPPQPDLTNRLLGFLASPHGQQLAVLAVTAFVTGGMRSYLDQTLDVNFYEDLFGAMAKPEHLAAVKSVVGVFARDVVGTYLAGPSAAQRAAQQAQEQQAAAMQAAAVERPRGAPRAQLRLVRSIQELVGGGTAQAGETAPEPGSPCGSSASGSWQRLHDAEQQQAEATAAAVAAAAPACGVPAGSDVDSDVLLRPEAAATAAAKGAAGGGDSARSHEGGWAVRTPPPAGEAAQPAAAPVLPQLLRLRAASAASGGSGSSTPLQREGSGNLEWISAVGKEWLNVAQHPQGRTVMVELAGAAAKEAAAGVSAALADRFRLDLRVRYVAGCASTIVQVSVGLAVPDSVYGMFSSTAGALARSALASCGMLCVTCFSGAPFRWLFPQLGAATRIDATCSQPVF
ncbi:PHLOEM PROTEIN 2-LIKE A10 [Micractinium conductrix]|uniref:PHLOEM PROTEIN 2-LIKE A10 n=1 Tax=Micractinium conductrix TaxID=554055 RepID=A0A2P6VGY3_9CHLO|nr:PHLOEM PROTEIN 2-LIKE A10 [Micractinium conductrix]|eukprot:PSC73345.1 PHLOEM PROTEIN 2-LIKE A10 [Micractinium conductrix]